MSERVYLYAIGREEGPIKIGISSHPGGRASNIQTACPFEISLLHSRECRDRVHALSQEQIIHSVHADKRLYGEWFDMDADLAAEAIDTALDIDAYFEQERRLNG